MRAREINGRVFFVRRNLAEYALKYDRNFGSIVKL